MDELEKTYKKIERKKFKLECKLEAIKDEMVHLDIIKNEHNGKLNKKRYYRKQHLEKVIIFYRAEINDLQLELNKIKKEMTNK